MVTQSDQQMNGNDAFEGFAIDLISEIAEILKLTMASDTACHYPGRRADALTFYADACVLPLFGTLAAS